MILNNNNNDNNFQNGYNQCLKDIQNLLHENLNNMEGDDFTYLLSHNVNPKVFNSEELTPELIVEGLLYRH